MRPTLAVFDFDGTLTSFDSSLPFIVFARGSARVARSLMIRAPFFAADLAVAAVREAKTDQRVSVRGRWGQAAHERLIRADFRGMSRADFRELGRRFAEEALDPMIAPGALEQVAWHRSRGHECVLVTESIDCYTEPWGHCVGFRKVVATRIAFDSQGRVAGTFDGGPCWGHAKPVRLREVAGPLEDYNLVVYGNEPDDHALLSVADHPVPVRAGESWAEIGARAKAALGAAERSR